MSSIEDFFKMRTRSDLNGGALVARIGELMFKFKDLLSLIFGALSGLAIVALLIGTVPKERPDIRYAIFIDPDPTVAPAAKVEELRLKLSKMRPSLADSESIKRDRHALATAETQLGDAHGEYGMVKWELADYSDALDELELSGDDRMTREYASLEGKKGQALYEFYKYDAAIPVLEDAIDRFKKLKINPKTDKEMRALIDILQEAEVAQ